MCREAVLWLLKEDVSQVAPLPGLLFPRGGFLWQEVEPFSTLVPVGRKRSEAGGGTCGDSVTREERSLSYWFSR